MSLIITTRNANEVFVYYGVYGDVEGSTGSAVARHDAITFEEVWNTQLAVYENEAARNYPVWLVFWETEPR